MTQAEWRERVRLGAGIDPDAGKSQLANGAFPYELAAGWIENEFAHDELFRDAVVRNIRGWAQWVYGDGEEPFWPGRDKA